MDIQTAIAHCLDDLPLAPNSVKAYRNGLRSFAQFLVESGQALDGPVETVSIDTFIAFFTWLSGRYAKKTAHTYAAGANAFMEWLVLARQLTPDYFDTLRYHKAYRRSHRRHEDRLPRWPQKDDVDRILAAVRAHTEASPIRERNIAALELLASSGCRVSEIVSLNVADMDLEGRSAVVTGKGSKERRVFFSTAAVQALQDYWQARHSAKASDPILGRHDRGAGSQRVKRLTTRSMQNIVTGMAVIAGIDPTKFTPHYFRHAFAIRVLSETRDIALVQDLLGHANPSSTRIYAKIYPEDLQAMHREIFD